MAWTGHTDTWRAGSGLRADGLVDAGDTTRGLLASAGDTRWFTRARKAADRAKADRLADQSYTGRLAEAGPWARWLTRAGVTANSLAAVSHRADGRTAARRRARRLTAGGLTDHWLARTRHSADSWTAAGLTDDWLAAAGFADDGLT